MEEHVLQPKFSDLPGMQIDSGGCAGLAHYGVPIGLVLLSAKAADNAAAAFVEQPGQHAAPANIGSTRQRLT
jgi:hypothetical protein